MNRVVTEYLDESSKLYPEKIAFVDSEKSITFSEVRNNAMRIGTFFITRGVFKKPIAVFLDKGIDELISFFGCSYSGNYYSPIDSETPLDRAENIVRTLKPEYIITNEKYVQIVEKLECDAIIILFSELMNEKICQNKIDKCARKIVDTDILYVLFTSGSTGMPKGTIISHKSVIAYIEWATKTFEIDESIILGNQTPFYFSMSVFDIYVTIKNACTMYIIPKKLFSLPIQLLNFIKEKNINLIYWVPSALMIVANSGALNKVNISNVKKILFAGEVMPTKQLNIWRSSLPRALYANLFGPTEVTDICSYFVVDRDFQDDEPLPIGFPCENVDLIILDEQEQEIKKGDAEKIGELCVRSSFLAYGYYNDEEKTSEVFVQNPLNNMYPEKIYRTGDLVKYNNRGELLYIGRKDFQIKVNGYRIELGEIETAISSIEEIKNSCCIFDEKNKIIICIFIGEIDKYDIRRKIKDSLPRYMMPHKYIKVDQMPLNANGKIDRLELKKEYEK